MTSEKTLARDFTKVDWYGLAGAEPFGEDEPLIREVNDDCYAVGDASGIGLFFSPEDEDEDGPEYYWSVKGTKEMVRLILNSLLEDITYETAEALGFERV